jgi:hypothetical protein
MREHLITLPELALVGATRGMIGFGAGLLVSRRLRRHQRRTVGTTLLVVGLLSTIPLALRIFRRRRHEARGFDERRRGEPASILTH